MPDVILGADAIHVPLTGIGRYAFELATHLPDCKEVDSLRLYSLGRWMDAETMRQRAGVVSAHALNRRSLRSIVARNKLAVKAFSVLMPIWSEWRMKKETEAVFHSPNFFLPPFPGRTLATIHDLSHLVCPQFHPAARVDFLKRELPKSLNRADFLITDAESVRQEVIEQFSWPEDKIRAVPLGVDASFHPMTESMTMPVLSGLGLTHGGYSLYVGTIEPRKNLTRLIRAYAELPQKLRERFPLVLAGSKGWQAEEIHDLMMSPQTSGWIKYLHYVPQTSLPSLYAGARLFCFPSLYEGFGLPPLEAMASGTPVLTSSTSSLPEVVGDAALKVRPEDVDAILAGLRMGLEDEMWRTWAIGEGLARARQFTWQSCANRTAALYKEESIHSIVSSENLHAVKLPI